MPSSDSSSLSEALPSDDERIKRNPSPKLTLKLNNGKLDFGRRDESPQSSPEPSLLDLGREATPPHEYVLADNPNIAVIVMFRSRFADAFLHGTPNVGPQDIEDGVVAPQPSEVVEDLLCGLLGLVLNRKKNPERGHYNRAVEEALSSQKHQWPSSWKGINPIPSSKTFSNLDPTARIDFLKTLVHWSLTSSEAIQATIKDSYKQTRHEDDVNQPLSVQPWGLDARKRKHYLIEGQVDTPFRIYRESSRKSKEHTWWSVASNIEGAKNLARDLRAEPGQAPHRLAAKITQAVPLFEERLEKRKRREYRVARRAAFARPEPGMSLYEGRTRGKRMNYNYDDDEVYGTDEASTRRSDRQSRVSTPAEGPTFTASGRAVRSQFGRTYGEPSGLRNGGTSTRGSSEMPTGQDSDTRNNRVSRSGRAIKNVDKAEYDSTDGLGDDEDEDGEDEIMSDQWEGDDEDVDGKLDEDEMDLDSIDESDDELALEQSPRSLVVKLRAGHHLSGLLATPGQRAAATALSGSLKTQPSVGPSQQTVATTQQSVDPIQQSANPPPSSSLTNGLEPTPIPNSHQSQDSLAPPPTSPPRKRSIEEIEPPTITTHDGQLPIAPPGPESHSTSTQPQHQPQSHEPQTYPSHEIAKPTTTIPINSTLNIPSPVEHDCSRSSPPAPPGGPSDMANGTSSSVEYPVQPVVNGVHASEQEGTRGQPLYPELQGGETEL